MLGKIKEDEMDRACSTCGREEMHTKFWSENLKGRDLSENLGLDWKIILEWILDKEGGKVWAGCKSIRIMSSGELL